MISHLANRVSRRSGGGIRGIIWHHDPAIWLPEGAGNQQWLMTTETDTSTAIPLSEHTLRMIPEWPNYNVDSWGSARRVTDFGIAERLELTVKNFVAGNGYWIIDAPEMTDLFDMVALMRPYSFTSSNPGTLGSGPALYHPTDGYWLGYSRGAVSSQTSPETMGIAHGVAPGTLMNGAANWDGYVPYQGYDPNTRNLYFRLRQEDGRLKVRWWKHDEVEPSTWPIDISRAPTPVYPAVQASYQATLMFWLAARTDGGAAELHPAHQ